MQSLWRTRAFLAEEACESSCPCPRHVSAPLRTAPGSPHATEHKLLPASHRSSISTLKSAIIQGAGTCRATAFRKALSEPWPRCRCQSRPSSNNCHVVRCESLSACSVCDHHFLRSALAWLRSFAHLRIGSRSVGTEGGRPNHETRMTRSSVLLGSYAECGTRSAHWTAQFKTPLFQDVSLIGFVEAIEADPSQLMIDLC